jgi:hypothetical protein
MRPLLWASLLTVVLHAQPIRFRDVAANADLRFVLDNHATPEKHTIETMAGGVAAFDADGDGRTDIFFTNGAAIPSLRKESPKYHNRLFRNVTETGGPMKFFDATADAGLAGEGYSMGAAAGDFDNDADVDLFVAGVYRNLLYRNRGQGQFEDVTAKSGIRSDYWTVAAGWFDYDNDGRLDLFLVNYTTFSPKSPRFCGDAERGLRVYCHPKFFEKVPNQLYRNRGDGTFEDVSKSSGIAEHPGRGMSVAFADYDSDSRLDVYVTNDALPSFLFHNLGKGKFEEVGLLAGAALLDHGKPVSAMGVDFRDYNNDNAPDIAATALAGELFPLFRGDAKGAFRDATFLSKLGPLTAKRSGWANALIDFNNDGHKDLFTANSHVNDLIDKFEASKYREPNGIYTNLGDGSFRDDSATFETARAHRGAAFADFNSDGRMDVVVSALNEPAELWENITEPGHRWLILRPVGNKSNRDGIGASIRVLGQLNHMTTAVGYASSSHYGVHFGLGPADRVDKLVVRWPSGIVQTLEHIEVNRILPVREPDSP